MRLSLAHTCKVIYSRFNAVRCQFLLVFSFVFSALASKNCVSVCRAKRTWSRDKFEWECEWLNISVLFVTSGQCRKICVWGVRACVCLSYAINCKRPREKDRKLKQASKEKTSQTQWKFIEFKTTHIKWDKWTRWKNYKYIFKMWKMPSVARNRKE